MIQLNKNKVKIIILWVGILTAFLLIFGAFSHTTGSFGSDDAFSLIRKFSGEQIKTVSASLVESFQSIII